MQSRRHPLDDFIYHPALCHLTPGATIPAIVEASVRRKCSHDHEEAARFVAPRIGILRTYGAAVRKTVTRVTSMLAGRQYQVLAAAAPLISSKRQR